MEFLLSVRIFISCKDGESKVFVLIPNKKQLMWFDMEYYGFIHFGPNTFTRNKWGDEKNCF